MNTSNIKDKLLQFQILSEELNQEIIKTSEFLASCEDIETKTGAQFKVREHEANFMHTNSGEKEKWNRAAELSNQNDQRITDLSIGNAKTKLALMSAYDDIEAYHPKVVSFDSKWNGFYYWIAFTPYPGGSQEKENPHILASNDMITWMEPKGFKNPLEPQPVGKSSECYNSDTHILYNDTLDRLEVFWRTVDDTSRNVSLHRKTSIDGRNWSDKEICISGDRQTRDYISPAVIFHENKYKMWCVTNGYKIIYSESSTGLEWENFIDIHIPMGMSMNIWHLDVIHTDIGYEIVYTAFINGQDRNTMTLYHSISEDNVNWQLAKPILKPSRNEFSWDNQGIYRASLMKIDDMYFLFYCASSKKWERGTGLSYGTDIRQLKGLDKNDVNTFQNIRSINMIYDAFLRNYGLQIAALQPDSSIWKACLRFSNSNEVKFVNDFSENVLINLAVNALRTSDGLKFIGKSAYFNSNEFKIYEPGKASVVGIGKPDFLRTKRVNDQSKAGGMEVSAVVFEDSGVWDGVSREGAIRYDSVRKKHVGYDGAGWHDLY